VENQIESRIFGPEESCCYVIAMSRRNGLSKMRPKVNYEEMGIWASGVSISELICELRESTEAVWLPDAVDISELGRGVYWFGRYWSSDKDVSCSSKAESSDVPIAASSKFLVETTAAGWRSPPPLSSPPPRGGCTTRMYSFNDGMAMRRRTKRSWAMPSCSSETVVTASKTQSTNLYSCRLDGTGSPKQDATVQIPVHMGDSNKHIICEHSKQQQQQQRQQQQICESSPLTLQQLEGIARINFAHAGNVQYAQGKPQRRFERIILAGQDANAHDEFQTIDLTVPDIAQGEQVAKDFGVVILRSIGGVGIICWFNALAQPVFNVGPLNHPLRCFAVG
jgi:hypothetical protein